MYTSVSAFEAHQQAKSWGPTLLLNALINEVEQQKGFAYQEYADQYKSGVIVSKPDRDIARAKRA